MKPKITKSVVLHRNFVEAERTLQSLVLACGGDEIVALVGCTRAGKSMLFDRLVAVISASTAGHGKGIMPSIQLRIETSQDGRISPKYLTLQMLKAVDHPLPAREMKRAGLDTVLSNKYRAHTEGREEDKAGDE